MNVRVTGKTVELVDTADFHHFAVQANADNDAALKASAAGQMRGETALINSHWLRKAGQNTPEWLASLDAMLALAASKGWLHGDMIQAHVQRGTYPPDSADT